MHARGRGEKGRREGGFPTVTEELEKDGENRTNFKRLSVIDQFIGLELVEAPRRSPVPPIINSHSIPIDRVKCGSTKNILCFICHNILYDPISCKTCENSFCTECIEQWLDNQRPQRRCPHQCNPFKKKNCPPDIINQLSILIIDCCYKPNGCNENISYDSLKEHESECDYKMQQCRGCSQFVCKKDIIEHEESCGFLQFFQCRLCGIRHQNKQTNHEIVDCLLNRQLHLEEKMARLDRDNRLLKERYDFIIGVLQKQSTDKP
ncbi:unnamed protein product [Didymodactylos carnosus]|uniref:RING-type domain-containing protein n=1 Tax=Didymodactylos carnosus TaxID=1234261 RepID=A0A814X2C5_9BILA|nr:unnamed protein product [Didymodactylos carnosus]CAF1210386.1 unnamed protein product [Didymodactylos carnosus]CAF3622735.1 unnamed protein product [Didymodactylos carnosus]CAF3974429.1 unnamed protein product [Didymodactylos carnosus]